MFDCLFSILLFSCFFAYITKFYKEQNITPPKQSETTNVFEMQISNHKKLKETCKKEGILKHWKPFFCYIFKNILMCIYFS